MKHTLLFPLTLLATCSQNPDGTTALGAKGSPVWFMTAPPEAIASHYQSSCQAYGHQPGTAEMARCIERSAEGERVAGRQAFAESMSRFGEQQRAQAAQYGSYRNRSISCRSHTSSMGYTTTNCH